MLSFREQHCDGSSSEGEWIRSGPFTLGQFTGTAYEYVRLESADIPDVYAYWWPAG
jgi:hypothetical protein